MVDRFLLRVAATQRRRVALTLGLQLVVTASHLPQAWLIAHGLAAMVTGRVAGVIDAALGVLALLVGRLGLIWLQARAAARLGTAVRVGLRDRALAGALVPAALHDPQRRDGALGATLVDGVDGVDTYVTRYLPAVAQVVVLIPVVVLLLAWVHPLAAALTGTAAAAAIWLPTLWKRMVGRRSQQHWDSYERLSSDLLEALRGMTTLRVLGSVGQARIRIAERSEALHRATVRVMRTSLFDTALIDVAVQAGSLAAVILAASDTASGQARPATAYLVLMLSSEVFRPVRELSRAWHAGYLGTSAVAALDRLGAGRAAIDAVSRGGRVPAADGAAVVLDDVSFRYPGSRVPILDHTDIEFPAGEVTAVVGPSGVGKSTLLDLLLGYLRPDRGVILFGGRPLASDDIALVAQRPVLFEGTLRENLRVGRPEASDEQLLKACAAAGILDEVLRMPRGLDTPIAASGASVSGGQRQRLALARAVLADRPVVLADEPTSALDPVAARTVSATLARLARDRVVIVVAHREESLDGVTRVLELRHGVLVPAAVGLPA